MPIQFKAQLFCQIKIDVLLSRHVSEQLHSLTMSATCPVRANFLSIDLHGSLKWLLHSKAQQCSSLDHIANVAAIICDRMLQSYLRQHLLNIFILVLSVQVCKIFLQQSVLVVFCHMSPSHLFLSLENFLLPSRLLALLISAGT